MAWKQFNNFIETKGLSAISEYFVLKLSIIPIGKSISEDIKYKKKLFIFEIIVIPGSWWKKTKEEIIMKFKAKGSKIKVKAICWAVGTKNRLSFLVRT